MRFQKIELRNFMSYESQVYSGLDEPGLVLLEGQNLDEGGSNGAGKSSLWDALSWGLFGQTVRGVKADDVINRRFRKGCRVAIHFEHKGKAHVVRRYRKDDDYNDRLLVDVRDLGEKEPPKVVELGTLALTQEWLLGELGIDFELFRCTILFAQGETFNFVSAGNRAQKEILSKVMRVDFESQCSKIKALLKSKQAEIDSRESKIAVLASHRVEDPDRIYGEEITEWYRDQSERVAALNERFERLNKERTEIEIDETDYSEIKNKLKAAHAKIGERARVIQEAMTEARVHVKDMDSKIAKLETLSGECPTCFQPIAGDACTHTRKKFEKMRIHWQALYEQHAKESAEWIGRQIKAQDKLDQIGGRIYQADAQREKFKRLDKECTRLFDDIERVASEVNPWIKKRDEQIKRQDEIIAKIDTLIKEQDEIRESLPYFEFWENAFGDAGIKSFVFDLICASLTNKANAHLNTLTNGNITVAFDTQMKLKSGEVREKFECSILGEEGKISYDAYSGGEKRRISLAVDLSLSEIMADQYGGGFNLAVFDEQTSYLDKQGRIGFMKMLEEMSKSKRVFVIDHDGEFKTMFDEIITIVKENGISRSKE